MNGGNGFRLTKTVVPFSLWLGFPAVRQNPQALVVCVPSLVVVSVPIRVYLLVKVHLNMCEDMLNYCLNNSTSAICSTDIPTQQNTVPFTTPFDDHSIMVC
jgi:hypothetical protein